MVLRSIEEIYELAAEKLLTRAVRMTVIAGNDVFRQEWAQFGTGKDAGKVLRGPIRCLGRDGRSVRSG